MSIILDIRTIDEYKEKHICDSILIPTNKPPLKTFEIEILEKNLEETVANMDTDAKIKVYCKKGIRAQYAVDYLKENGFTNVENIGGLEESSLQQRIENGEYEICLCKGEEKMSKYCR